jgi:hypothetical protein
LKVSAQSRATQNGNVQPISIVDSYIGNSPTVVSPTKAGIIDSLLTEEKSIKVQGDVITSFYFKFKDLGSDTVFLWYKNGYAHGR